MLLCFYLFVSSLLILDVQTEVSLLSLYSSMKMYVQVNDVEDLENDHFAIPGECLHIYRLGIAKQFIESFQYFVKCQETSRRDN